MSQTGRRHLQRTPPLPDYLLMKCAYLGPRGTYSEFAARQYKSRFNTAADLVAYPSFYNLFEALDKGDCDTILIPIENSIGGFVDTVLDLMIHYPKACILAEYILPIQCNLIAQKGVTIDTITDIASHPQPISQSASYLHQQFPKATLHHCSSSADAVRLMNDSTPGTMAVIGSSFLASEYELSVLAANIQDHDHNQTRFALITRSIDQKAPYTPANDLPHKTTITCSMQHDRPGSLYTLLGYFEERRINLSHITSRPTKNAVGQYVFFIDYDTPSSPNDHLSLLEDLEHHCISFKCLGTFTSHYLN